jgi:hydrogenase expression/formation protein HypE
MGVNVSRPLPLGKLPAELLAGLLARHDTARGNPRVVVGPGVGLDCAVLDFGDRYLVLKTDPITFATEDIGWYAVQINANDIACSGAMPAFFMATVLLPEAEGNRELAERIFGQISAACADLGATLVGGHTEITHGIGRPIVMGAMLGEVSKEQLVSAAGAEIGDTVLLTKGYPVEAVAIIAREFASADRFDVDFLARCRGFLYAPGISVLRDARVALHAGKVTAMHDPTEGGVATGLWELAEASGHSIEIDPDALRPLPEGERLCRAFGLDPIGCIASGALLLTTPEPEKIRAALEAEGIPATAVGRVVAGRGVSLVRPERDEIARLFDAK